MKKIFTLSAIAAFFMIAGPVFAQEATGDKSTIFEINPLGQDIISNKAKFRSFYKFRIINVNAIKLSGYATAKPVNFESSIPAIFADTKLPAVPGGAPATPGLESTHKVLLHNVKLNLKRSATVEEQLKTAQAELANTQKQLQCSNTKLVDLKEQLKNTFVSDYDAFVNNYRNLQLYTVAEDTLYKMLPDVIVSDQTALQGNSKQYMLSMYDVTDEAMLDSKLKETLAAFNKSYVDLKQAYEALNKTSVTDVSDITGSLKNKSGSIMITVANASATLKADPLFLDQYTAATKIYDELNKGGAQAKIFNKAFKGINLFRQIISPHAFVVYTDPYQINDDENVVTPALKNSKGTVVKEFNPVNIKAFGGGKVDFSTGYLVTFRGDDNYAYYYADGKIKGVAKQSHNSITNSIGALAHWYRRSANSASMALSGGFSLTTDGVIGFYVGGSGLFLEKNRLALSAGLSFVKVKVLNTGNLDKVADSNKYTFNSTETTINYDALYKPGFFVGITYNIFGTNKSAAK